MLLRISHSFYKYFGEPHVTTFGSEKYIFHNWILQSFGCKLFGCFKHMVYIMKSFWNLSLLMCLNRFWEVICLFILEFLKNELKWRYLRMPKCFDPWEFSLIYKGHCLRASVMALCPLWHGCDGRKLHESICTTMLSAFGCLKFIIKFFKTLYLAMSFLMVGANHMHIKGLCCH